MTENYNLKRFLDAQEFDYSRALNKVKSGKKLSHWMWYIFPQYKGLGWSETSQLYAIVSKEEAVAYFNNPILGSRLKEITKELCLIEGKSANAIFGTPDDLKLKSCMTLFHSVQDKTDLFIQVIETYFNGELYRKTVTQLNN